MKKTVSLLPVIALMLFLAACGKQISAPEGTPEQIIEKIYAAHRAVDLPLAGRTIDLTDENDIAYNLGLTSGEKLSAAAVSEPMMGQPYSLAVARVKDPADAQQTAKDFLEKIDGRKWICMEADTRTAAYCGDLVMFFMVSSEFAESVTAESMSEAFDSVCGGKATIVG